ncbi:MAG: sigma-70 family RNA polymerase sigma factor [Bacteroidota bacterium]
MEKPRDIVDQLRSGERQIVDQAFRTLYANTFPQVLAYVNRNSGSYEDAKEVLQDAMSIVCEKVLDRDFVLNVGTNMETYIYAVARNKWKQRLHKNKKLVLYENIGGADEEILHQLNQDFRITDGENQIVQVWVNEEDNADLIKTAENIVIELMSREAFAKCKEILWDFYRQGMSMGQIADKHQYNNDKTAKVKKAKCMARLRKYCEKIPFLQKHFKKKNVNLARKKT